MKYQTFTFIFKEPLTKDQEEALIGSLQAIKENVRKELMKIASRKKGIRNTILQKIGGNTAVYWNIMQNTTSYLLENLSTVFILEKKGERTYVYKVAAAEIDSLSYAGKLKWDAKAFRKELEKKVFQAYMKIPVENVTVLLGEEGASI